MNYNKSKSIIYVLMWMMIIFSLQQFVNCDSTNNTLTYQNCSSTGKCKICENEYICKQCTVLNQCCPKYCKSCTSATLCTECQLGLHLVSRQNRKICNPNSIGYDENRLRNDSSMCKQGYYLEKALNLCEKCLVPNCKLCINSITCFACNDNFVGQNGMCLSSNQYNNNTDSKSDIRPNNDQNGQSSLTFWIISIGLVIGIILTFILIKFYVCKNKNSQNLCKKLQNIGGRIKSRFKKSESRQPMNPQIQKNDDMQMPTVNDQHLQYVRSKMIQQKQLKNSHVKMKQTKDEYDDDDIKTQG